VFHSLTVPIIGMVLLVAPAPLDAPTPVFVRFPMQLLAVAPAVALLAGAAAGRIVFQWAAQLGQVVRITIELVAKRERSASL